MEWVEKTFTVAGMTCQSCVALIAEAIERLPGVIRIRGDLASGTFQIVYDAQQVMPEAIIQTIAQAGEMGSWQHTFCAEVLE